MCCFAQVCAGPLPPSFVLPSSFLSISFFPFGDRERSRGVVRKKFIGRVRVRPSRPGRAKLGTVELVVAAVQNEVPSMDDLPIKVLHLDRGASRECNLGAVGSLSPSFARPGRLGRTRTRPMNFFQAALLSRVLVV